MLPQSSEILYFCEVAQTLNFSRAAERLGVTQPSLSQSIKKLELNLGVELFVRTKTGVHLTHFGQEFFQRANLFLEEWRKLENLAAKNSEEVRGKLSIGCHPSVAQYTLNKFLPEALKEFPGLEIELLHDLSRKVTEKVISFQIDLGLVVNPVAHPDLVIIPLQKDEVTLWQHPKNKNADVLICDPDLLQIQTILGKLSKGKASFKRVIHSSNLEVIANLVQAKAGVGILPGNVAKNEKYDLEVYDAKAPVFHDQIALIYRREMKQSLTMKTMIDLIKKALI